MGVGERPLDLDLLRDVARAPADGTHLVQGPGDAVRCRVHDPYTGALGHEAARDRQPDPRRPGDHDPAGQVVRRQRVRERLRRRNGTPEGVVFHFSLLLGEKLRRSYAAVALIATPSARHGVASAARSAVGAPSSTGSPWETRSIDGSRIASRLSAGTSSSAYQ